MIKPQTPNNILVTYMSRRCRRPNTERVLDIGSHSLANALWLRERGLDVTTVDSDLKAWANYHVGINRMNWADESFEYIIDINTLCHVKEPPYGAIRNWLASDGIFFSIHPAFDTDPVVYEGKDYTFTATEFGLRNSLKMFTQVAIFPSEYPHFPGQLKSWVVEARK